MHADRRTRGDAGARGLSAGQFVLREDRDAGDAGLRPLPAGSSMKLAAAEILILAGLGNSGPGHWQRRWAERFSTGRVVEQDEWDEPDRRDWTAAIVEAVELAQRPV